MAARFSGCPLRGAVGWLAGVTGSETTVIGPDVATGTGMASMASGFLFIVSYRSYRAFVLCTRVCSRIAAVKSWETQRFEV